MPCECVVAFAPCETQTRPGVKFRISKQHLASTLERTPEGISVFLPHCLFFCSDSFVAGEGTVKSSSAHFSLILLPAYMSAVTPGGQVVSSSTGVATLKKKVLLQYVFLRCFRCCLVGKVVALSRGVNAAMGNSCLVPPLLHHQAPPPLSPPAHIRLLLSARAAPKIQK